MEKKSLFFVTVGPKLIRAKDAQGRISGNPPLSAYGKKVMAELKPWLDEKQIPGISQVHCGLGRRFLQAARLLFPYRPPAELKFSPLWGNETVIRQFQGQARLILGSGEILPRDCLYDHLPPTLTDEREMNLWRTSTQDSAFNLPDRTVVVTENRPLVILGLPPRLFRAGALYRLDYQSLVEPLEFVLLAAPKPPLVLAAWKFNEGNKKQKLEQYSGFFLNSKKL